MPPPDRTLEDSLGEQMERWLCLKRWNPVGWNAQASPGGGGERVEEGRQNVQSFSPDRRGGLSPSFPAIPSPGTPTRSLRRSASNSSLESSRRGRSRRLTAFPRPNGCAKPALLDRLFRGWGVPLGCFSFCSPPPDLLGQASALSFPVSLARLSPLFVDFSPSPLCP